MFIIVESKAGLVEVNANLLVSVSLSLIGPKSKCSSMGPASGIL